MTLNLRYIALPLLNFFLLASMRTLDLRNTRTFFSYARLIIKSCFRRKNEPMLAYGILSERFGRLHALSVRNSFFFSRVRTVRNAKNTDCFALW